MTQDIVAKIPKDQMKALFYLFNGKPDSRVKVFTAPIQLEKKDIDDLNNRISLKLRTHSIDAAITTVRIGYTGSRFDEFGTWDGFDNHTWESADKVDEVIVKWDFSLKLEGFQLPQRHTLLVRISTDFKASNFFQLITSSNHEDFEDLDINLAPGFCRVDFINAQMSKELINEVTEWFSARRSPKLIPDIWYWCKKHRQMISQLLDHWFILSFVLLEIGAMLYGSGRLYDGMPPLSVAVCALLFSTYLLFFPVKDIAHLIGKKLFGMLSAIEGSRVVFDFTDGDRKAAAERYQNNNQKGFSFMGVALLNVIYNIASSFIFLWLKG